MDKDKLILKDGSEIALETGANLGSLTVMSADKAEMLDTWGKLTEDNLMEVCIKNSAGLAVGRYKALALVSETSIVQQDGTVHTAFRLREKDTLEKRMDAVEASQAVQDETIEGLSDELTNTQLGLAEAYELAGGGN